MKHWMQRIRALIGLAVLFAAAHAGAQTTAAGPYYATPSWDQAMPAASRFVVLSNFNGEAVLDRETGLVWQRTPNLGGQDVLSFAFDHCVLLINGGRLGWRLPTLPELDTLFTLEAYGNRPALPPGHPFTVPASSSVWTTTQAPGAQGQHYALLYGATTFFAGQANDTQQLGEWCVRGPGSAS